MLAMPVAYEGRDFLARGEEGRLNLLSLTEPSRSVLERLGDVRRAEAFL
jgi:hypothetical protein